MPMAVLMPLPATDFDPSESAVPWLLLTKAGHQVEFATPQGLPAQADPRMLSGAGLGPWRFLLRADQRARIAYRAMAESEAFKHPRAWSEIAAGNFDGLILPGGHAQGMKPYLESPDLQQLAAGLLAAGKPVAAVCHGVLVLARARRADGLSAIRDYRVTALTAQMEWSAYLLTGLWLGRYYRTYQASVQSEVSAALASAKQFDCGPFALLRDSNDHLTRGFVVRDRNLLTARWPGDVHRFGNEFIAMLAERA